MSGESFHVQVKQDDCARDGVLLLAFPTVGQAGPVAANFLVRTLDLKPAGGVFGRGFDPVAKIAKGRVTPPVRAYCKAMRCKPDCEGLTVLVSERAVPSDKQTALAARLVEWAMGRGFGMAVVLEGVTLPNAAGGCFGIATNDEAETLLEQHDLTPLKEGSLGGLGAAFLTEAARRDFRGLGLLAPATGTDPDPGAAATLLEAIDRVLVDVKVDPEPLQEESKKVEEARARALELPLYY